jgi:hypothetical protein
MPALGPVSLQDIPPIARDPAFAAMLIWLAAALGYRVTRALRAPLAHFTAGERGLLYAALGVGCLQWLPMGLSAVGHMSPGPIRWAMALLAALLAPDLVRVARGLAGASSRLLKARVSPEVALWVTLLVAFMGLLLVRALVIDVMGDDDGYHLTAPRRWLEAGGLVYLPTYTQTNSPMGFDMLYVIALAVWGPVGAKMLHFAAGLFCLLGVFLLGRRLVNGRVGALAVSLLLIPNRWCNVPTLFCVAFTDLAVCWMALASLLAWMAWDQHRERALLWCAALCAGFAASFKFTAVCVPFALLLVILLEARRTREGPRPAAGASLGALVLSIGPLLPWLLRNWIVVENPLYPMLSSVIPTRDWSAEQARVFRLFFRYYNWAKAPSVHLPEAWRKEALVAAAACLLAFGAIGVLRSRRPASRGVVAFATTLALASVSVTGLYFRFWLPALACGCVLLAGLALRGWSTRRWALGPALLALALAFAIRVHGDRPRFARDLGVALGRRSLQDRYRGDPLWDTWTYLNSHTPTDARVLVAAFYTTFGASSAGTFFVDRPCYATDSHLQTFIRFDEWPAFLESVARAGISDVVISDTEFVAGRVGFSFPAAANEYPFCRRLVDLFGTKLSQSGHLQVYRLRPLEPEAGLTGRPPRARRTLPPPAG